MTAELPNGLHQIQGINMTTDMEFMSALLFDAYIADAITDGEVRRACAILSITFPPEKGNQATRLAKHRAAEYARQEAERERIRAEERARAEREARELVEAEHRAESARQQAEDERQRAAERVIETHVAVAPEKPHIDWLAATPTKPGPMLKLGEINARLSPISISSDGLAQLGFTPDQAVKTAKLYRAAGFNHPVLPAELTRQRQRCPAHTARGGGPHA